MASVAAPVAATDDGYSERDAGTAAAEQPSGSGALLRLGARGAGRTRRQISSRPPIGAQELGYDGGGAASLRIEEISDSSSDGLVPPSTRSLGSV